MHAVAWRNAKADLFASRRAERTQPETSDGPGRAAKIRFPYAEKGVVQLSLDRRQSDGDDPKAAGSGTRRRISSLAFKINDFIGCRRSPRNILSKIIEVRAARRVLGRGDIAAMRDEWLKVKTRRIPPWAMLGGMGEMNRRQLSVFEEITGLVEYLEAKADPFNVTRGKGRILRGKAGRRKCRTDE